MAPKRLSATARGAAAEAGAEAGAEVESSTSVPRTIERQIRAKSERRSPTAASDRGISLRGTFRFERSGLGRRGDRGDRGDRGVLVVRARSISKYVFLIEGQSVLIPLIGDAG